MCQNYASTSYTRHCNKWNNKSIDLDSIECVLLTIQNIAFNSGTGGSNLYTTKRFLATVEHKYLNVQQIIENMSQKPFLCLVNSSFWVRTYAVYGNHNIKKKLVV